jgi:hypothetical protein
LVLVAVTVGVKVTVLVGVRVLVKVAVVDGVKVMVGVAVSFSQLPSADRVTVRVSVL